MQINALEPDHFSYAAPDDPRLKRIVIRAIERMSGQPYLKHLYETNKKSPIPGENFWDAAIRLLELNIDYNEEALFPVPRKGPLVIVANHPFGVLDGIVMCHLAAKMRDDFRVLTNSVLYRAEEVRPYLIPVNFAETKEALAANLKSRAEARYYLKNGGCIVIFPAGAASTTPRPWDSKAVDLEWGTFSAGLIAQTRSTVLPIYFAGQNSCLFQLASHVSMTLRLSLFFKEVYDNIGAEIRIRIGKLIPFSESEMLDRKELMKHLRNVTYAMAPLTPDPPRPQKPRHQKCVRKIL
jgi:putative hemolysin